VSFKRAVQRRVILWNCAGSQYRHIIGLFAPDTSHSFRNQCLCSQKYTIYTTMFFTIL